MDSERRTHKRIPVKMIAHCTRTKSGEYQVDKFISFTEDFSERGARIVSSKEMNPGERISVSLEIPAYFIPVLALSEVVWVKDTFVSRGNVRAVKEAGIRFLNIDAEDARKLINFVSARTGVN